MSLVNDVLDSQNYDKPSGYVGHYYDQMNKPNNGIKLLIIVLVCSVTCFIAGFSFFYFLKPINTEHSQVKPINGNVIVAKKSESITSSSPKPVVDKPPLVVPEPKIAKKEISKSNISSKPTRVENISRDLPFHISEEIKLRNMLSTDPASVYPYITKHHNEGKKNARLLAIAAQAEQKIDNHDNAIQLYTQLIELEKKEPRWYSAIGFSFERNGDVESAYKMYSAAIQMGGLPNNLNAFTLSRLANLNDNKEAKI